MNHQKPISKLLVPKLRRAESGQAIVLMALVLVVLLGMLGLAIDGGGLYFLWRDAQNASDAAVLAASYARCTKGDSASVIAAGLEAAAKNGFENNGSSNKVVVSNPPTTGPQAGNSNYIQVDIWAKKPTYFIQLVYKGPVEVTTSAVGYCSPPFNGSDVPGMWAGSHTCQDTVNWTGSNAWIEGAMFSNFQIKFNGSNTTLEDGAIQAHDIIQESQSGNVQYDLPDYPPEPGAPYNDDPLHLDMSLYAPTGAVYENVNLKHALTDPNVFDDGGDYKVHQGSFLWSPGNNRTLEGLYYVNGDVNLGTNVQFGPKGITIVATGEIDFAGGSATTYYKDITNPTADGVQYPGIMLASYLNAPCVDSHPTDGIKIPGPSSTLWGVFYAPKSGVAVSGSSMTIIGSIVADNINYSGSSGHLKYDPNILPPRPPSIQMAQ